MKAAVPTRTYFLCQAGAAVCERRAHTHTMFCPPRLDPSQLHLEWTRVLHHGVAGGINARMIQKVVKDKLRGEGGATLFHWKFVSVPEARRRARKKKYDNHEARGVGGGRKSAITTVNQRDLRVFVPTPANYAWRFTFMPHLHIPNMRASVYLHRWRGDEFNQSMGGGWKITREFVDAAEQQSQSEQPQWSLCTRGGADSRSILPRNYHIKGSPGYILPTAPLETAWKWNKRWMQTGGRG